MSLRKMMISGAAALMLVGAANAYVMADGVYGECDTSLAKYNGCQCPDGAVVQIAKDGTGDYLLAPVYYAVNNWSTELKVVNTNTTRAIVAKVVIREAKESKEIIDFAIYLTPGDVWTGTIFDDNGVIKVKSTDDSMIIGGKIASPSNPIIVGAHDRRENLENGKYHYENWHGYVEIFGMASYDPAQIVEDYNNAHDPDVGPAGEPCQALDKKAFYTMVKDGKNIKNAYDAKDVSNCDLMGKETIYAEDSNVNNRRFMQLNMMALENFSQGPVFTGALGADTLLSAMSSKGYDVLPEYDAALAKEHIYVMYEGDGTKVFPLRTHFTVPTKKYWFDAMQESQSNGGSLTMPDAYTPDNLYNEGPVPPFSADTGSEWVYTLNSDGEHIIARDMSENCNKCKTGEVSGTHTDCSIPVHEEVHFFEYDNTNPANLYDSSNPYKSLLFATGGYVDFDLRDIKYITHTSPNKPSIHKAIGFLGMPIVPTTFYAKDIQGIYLNNWLYNQYKDARVYIGD